MVMILPWSKAKKMRRIHLFVYMSFGFKWLRSTFLLSFGWTAGHMNINLWEAYSDIRELLSSCSQPSDWSMTSSQNGNYKMRNISSSHSMVLENREVMTRIIDWFPIQVLMNELTNYGLLEMKSKAFYMLGSHWAATPVPIWLNVLCLIAWFFRGYHQVWRCGTSYS